ncbi:DUF3617 domain-containing protein [Nevskia sp.]|uniref:DUF3617 domain-containing protein n=1 Tax=Nevskia sp. TaxID=1929292 RepID=UPI0025CD5951|nr:DUF3617 domain-containing protein [Nevskia sp.]
MPRKLVFLAAVLAFTAAHAEGFKEGQWEITTKMDMPGMPQMPELPSGVKLPPGVKLPGVGGSGFTAKQCLKKDQAAPANSRSDLDCEMTQKKFHGDTFEWATHCTGKDGGVMDGEGKATYSGDAMTSQFHMHGTAHGQPMDMTMNSTGKYLGPCPN